MQSADIDLMQKIDKITDLLTSSLAEYPMRGRVYAEAQKKYRIALRQEILQERAKGTPVTIINDICRGEEKVAELCFERDIAESLYKASQESINVYKLRLRIAMNPPVHRGALLKGGGQSTTRKWQKAMV